MLDSRKSFDGFTKSRQVALSRSHCAKGRAKRGHHVFDVVHSRERYFVKPDHFNLASTISQHRRVNAAAQREDVGLRSSESLTSSRAKVDFSGLDSQLRRHLRHSVVLSVKHGPILARLIQENSVFGLHVVIK